MCFTSLLPINSPSRRLRKHVKTRTRGWQRRGSSTQLGGAALTSVITGGCLTPAFATLWLWPGPSVEVVCLGWEPCIVLRTRQASLPLIADLMPTALNVSVWYLFKNHRLKKKYFEGMHWCSPRGWNGFHVLKFIHRMETHSDFPKQANGTTAIWLKQQEVWQMIFFYRRWGSVKLRSQLCCASLHLETQNIFLSSYVILIAALKGN